MKGFPLISAVLVALRKEPRTITELAAEIGIGYISMLRVVADLRKSGLVVSAGRRGASTLYAFHHREAIEAGRPLTLQFLRLWNALLDPDSASNIAADIGVTENHVRKTIHEMRRLGLCRIAGWQRNAVALPTALYALGSHRDADRPKAHTEKEYNRRANQRRKARKLYAALTWRLAA